ncbi:MAG: cupin domain-containing protein [Chloroflexi bacterium]|nr:cupin domain-containing protein [Chloroflexota bacterium]
MSIVEGYRFEPMVGDPDDHRPTSIWALVVDPGDSAGRVNDLAVISERIAAGDRIPLHVHRVSEVILAHGSGRFTLGSHVRSVEDGAVIFIPAGVPHGFHNDGDQPLPVEAVFPTSKVWIRTLERNPAPGTERDKPQPGATYDLRTGAVEFDAS